MRKRIGTLLAVASLVVPLSSSVLASVPQPEPARLATADGQVVSVDAAAKSLVVRIDGPSGTSRELTLELADDTKIVKDGAAIALGDLRRGEKITVTYRRQDDKQIAVNIGVQAGS